DPGPARRGVVMWCPEGPASGTASEADSSHALEARRHAVVHRVTEPDDVGGDGIVVHSLYDLRVTSRRQPVVEVITDRSLPLNGIVYIVGGGPDSPSESGCRASRNQRTGRSPDGALRAVHR